jgi:hypothetical protein
MAIGPAIAALRVVMMLVTSTSRFSIERSVSGAAVGAEMTLVKTLARARIRLNFMFAKVLLEGVDAAIFDEFKGRKECDTMPRTQSFLEGMLKKISFVACGRLLFIATSSAGFPIHRHHHYLQERGQSQGI